MPRSTTSHDDDFAHYVERIVAEMPAEVPIEPDGWRPLNAPWYRTTPAVTAVGAIAAACVLIGVSAFLLVYHRDSTGQRGSSTHNTSGSVAPTPERSAPPSSGTPNPPAPSSDVETPTPGSPTPGSPTSGAAPSGAAPSGAEPSASTQDAPPAVPPPPASSAPNLSTQVTRPPDISVRPTHRPAFPS